MNAPLGPIARELPSNLEAEQALLGAVLNDAGSIFVLTSFLEPEHFSEPLHERIYATCLELLAAGRKPSVVTLKDFLPYGEPVGEETVGAYLAGLVADSIGSGSAEALARSVVDLATRRSLITIGSEIQAFAYDSGPSETPKLQIEEAIERLSTLGAVGLKRHQRQSTAAAAAEALLERLADKDKRERPISTGLTALDRIIGGYRRGNLVIAAGRPGAGKSTLAGSSALKVAGAGRGVLFFSLEMTRDDLSARLMTDLCYRVREPIVYQRLLDLDDFSDEEQWLLQDAAKRLKNVPLIIDPRQGMTIAEIGVRTRRVAESMKRKNVRLELVVVDHLGKVRLPNRDGRNVELGEVTSAAAELAKELDACVLMLCQLNRQSEHRDNKRPQLGDLRESGHIEEDADAVIGLYREAYYLSKQKGDDTIADIRRQDRLAEVWNDLDAIVLKNRHGAEGIAKLWTHMGCAVVTDREYRGG